MSLTYLLDFEDALGQKKMTLSHETLIKNIEHILGKIQISGHYLIENSRNIS